MKFVRQPLLNDSPFLFSEESRFLMHIFATQTAQMLFPAAPEFFLRRMISAALETPHLLYALLASSCSHHGRLVRDSSPASRVILLKYTSLAISGLREALLDPEQATKAETVTTAMALCTNDVCNGDMDVGRAHLRGVLRLLMTFLEHERMSYHKMNDTYVQCLVKWFRSMDVLAALSGVHGECIHRPGSGALDQLSDHTSWHVDCISGYSLRLMPILARISKLVKEVRHLAHGTVETDCALPRGTRIQAEELEMELYQFLEPRTSNDALSCGGSVVIELRCSHFAFVHAALLHLHRRVQLLPKAHIKVRTDVANILDILRFIEPDSSMNVLLLWPVFSAGCETEEWEVQNEIFTRMGHMQDRGMGNFTRARQVLRQYWTFGSHLPWDLHLEQLGLQLILF
ncbi:hypothetical protein N7539_000617 [Penicillium diatomitis]|uniref:Uncharacterized protein n=1 Tax=Penicillium diatomitis TaxID=2819901 RepID=A0A9W9XM01_9EURO|nr:uncharacterized protein N7539_000617 [Penicillium diatomitis]KAJ5495501.1 hypothetical protein N7539_000617 [Penicillium diatomitis]